MRPCPLRDAPDRQAGNWLRARNWLNEAIVPVALLKLPAGNLRRMSFQPGGTLALTLNGTNLRIWDWRYEQPLGWSASRRDVTDAGWSPDGNRLALATSAGEVQIVEPTTGNIRQRFSASDPVVVVQWSPDGTRSGRGGQAGAGLERDRQADAPIGLAASGPAFMA
jgi:WD40 repeat protein